MSIPARNLLLLAAASIAVAIACSSGGGNTSTAGQSPAQICITQGQPCLGAASASCCVGLACSAVTDVCVIAPDAGPDAGRDAGTDGGADAGSGGTTVASSTGTGTTGQATGATTGHAASSGHSGTTGSITFGTVGASSGFGGSGGSLGSGGSIGGSGSFGSLGSIGSAGSIGSGGSIGGSTGGSTSGGSDGGYAGGCGPDDYFATELLSCATNADCNCGQICASDPVQGQVCLSGCKVSADCPDPITFCAAGACVSNTCNAVYAPCGVASPGASDGYCLPYDDGNEIDLCTFNGSLAIGANCQGAQNTFGGSVSFAIPTNQNCAGGLVCDPDTSTCAAACNSADAGPACPHGTACTSIDFSYADIGDCE